ncbi:MAG TPA: RHS repeat-associated core domain-containing protein [Polyangia bacterium]
MRARPVVVLGMVVLLAGGLAAPAAAAPAAPVSGAVQNTVDAFTGQFGSTIKVEVPPFHGLEPAVSLSYASGGGNGLIGVGWGLAAGSVIERASPGKGSPKYDDASDIYLLDGQELVGSTALGGTHTTKIQSYVRVTRDLPNNRWFVWRKDGVKATYTAQLQTGKGTFRWALSTVQDPFGNTVTYAYWCDGAPALECYLDTISYNGNVVQFYRETVARPDVVTYATGAGLSQIRYRLQTIEVTVSGTRARAYALTYDLSPSTGRSRLKSVQQHGQGTGSGAATTGTVAAGTALPATSFTYAAPPAGFVSNSNWAGHGGTQTNNALGDFNGDGKMDMAGYAGNGVWDVRLSTGTSFGGAGSGGWAGHAGGQTNNFVGDFNGDGKSDIAGYAGNGLWDVRLSTGTSFGGAGSGGWAGHAGGQTNNVLGDFNGDGKTDMAGYAGNGQWHVCLSTGTSFSCSLWAGHGGGQTNNFLGDFNGDGKTDIAGYAGNGVWDVRLSTGSSFGGAGSGGWAGHAGGQSNNVLGDFNGDGKTDIAGYAGNGVWDVRLSTGTSFGGPGSGGWAGHWGGPSDNFVGDYDGDGKSDLAGYASGGLWNVTLASAVATDVVVGVATDLGGSAAITYAPSSAWVNTNNPPVTPTVTALAVSDGRGNTATTTYSYAGYLFDPLERRSLGFSYSKTVAPCSTGESLCPYDETWWQQDYGSVSKPFLLERHDGSGTLLARTRRYYTTNGATVPYTSLETGRREYFYAGAASKTSYLSRGYDAFGNVTQQVNYGDEDLTGDEATTVYTYRPNTSASLYLVDKPAAVEVYPGVVASGTKLVSALYVYDGNTTWDAVPTAGRLTQQQSWANTTDTYVTKRFAYDPTNGNVTSRTNELNATDTVTYDATKVYPESVTNAVGKTVSSTFDPVLGVELVATNANGQSQTRQYDALGRLTRSSGPLGGYEQTTYFFPGVPGSQYVETRRPGADGQEQWTRKYYDGQGRTYKTVTRGPADIIAETVYDGRGQVVSSSAPYYAGAASKWTTVAYDALGRTTRVTAPDGRFRTQSYDIVALPGDPDFPVARPCRTETDEMGHAVRTCADAEGRTLTVSEFVAGAEVRLRFAYDARGELTQVTDGSGSVRSYTVDSLGRKLAMTDPNAGAWSYGYDAAGRLTAQADAKGQVTTFGYDALGRRTQKVVKRADGTTEATVTWGYDQARSGYYNVGAQTSMTDPSGTVTYDYDAAGRQVKTSRTIGGTSYTLERGYGAAGQPLWTRFPDGTEVGTAAAPLLYDGAGRVTTVPGLVSGATYTAAGTLATQTNANGTLTTYSYDPNRGWLTGIVTTVQVTCQTCAGTCYDSCGVPYDCSYACYCTGGGTIQNLAYTRDAEGTITQVTSPFAGEGWSYLYDSLHRLTSATNLSNGADSQTFTYTASGNLATNSRLAGSYAYPGATAARPHAVTAAGGNTYSYDANGNLVAGAGRTLTWTAENLPATIGTASLTYDGNGMRLTKVAGATTTVYLGDEYEVTGATATKYVALAGRPVAKLVGPTKYWLHTDDKGSIQAVTDASGLEVQRLKYRPYGERLSTGTSHGEARSYTGQRQDESGLLYLHARYYDPALGRFISPDPKLDTRSATGPNGYAYCVNDPINRIDPDGQFSLGRFLRGALKVFLAPFKAVVGMMASDFQHGLKSALKGGLLTTEGREEFTKGQYQNALELNGIPWVGGIMALPHVAAGAAAQGKHGTALRASLTFALAVAAIAVAVVAGCFGLGFWSGLLVTFVAGFVSGFLIGVLNGTNGNRAFFCGMAFGMFCAFTVYGSFSGWGSFGNAAWYWQALTVLSSLSTVTATVRGYAGDERAQFDHRFDYVGHEGVGGNYMGGPLAGATPWNYQSYLHDMAGAREGYGTNFGSRLFPCPFALDLRVYYRSFTGDSYFG